MILDPFSIKTTTPIPELDFDRITAALRGVMEIIVLVLPRQAMVFGSPAYNFFFIFYRIFFFLTLRLQLYPLASFFSFS